MMAPNPVRPLAPTDGFCLVLTLLLFAVSYPRFN